jgi:hypothetical protein
MPVKSTHDPALLNPQRGMILGQGLFLRNDNFTPGANGSRGGATRQIAGRRGI